MFLENLGNPLPVFFEKGMMKNAIILPKGLYLAYHFHDGYCKQSYLSVITLNGHDHIENKFIEAKNIIPENNNAYSLEFNPFTLEVRLNQNTAATYGKTIFCKLSD